MRTGMAAMVPSASHMALAAGDSAEKRITLNGRRRAASPGAPFRFPAGVGGVVSPTASLTGIVTSPTASRAGSNHSLPTATGTRFNRLKKCPKKIAKKMPQSDS